VVIIAMVMIARSPAGQKKIKNASFPTVWMPGMRRR
jgi:hypothetical protein